MTINPAAAYPPTSPTPSTRSGATETRIGDVEVNNATDGMSIPAIVVLSYLTPKQPHSTYLTRAKR